MQTKSIFRLSVLTSALVLAGAVQALGLGKLTVQSSLGQPLSARIELSSASKEELDSLTAKVADPSLYRQNNLAYAPVLSRARVSVERNAGGQPYLEVTTPTSVNEPYLDLMVEVNWAAGRVVREYTFLLDPPGAGAPAPVVEPVTPVRQGSATTRPAARAAAAPAAAAAGAAPTPAPAAPQERAEPKAAAGDKYTVQRGDTLSKIAAEVKPGGVSLEQMLVALFKSNESAFDGNMNRLRSGSILTIPSGDDAGATPAGEAARIVRVQATDWRSYRDRVAAGATEAQDAPGRAAAGKIGTTVEEKTPAAPAGRDQLKVSREAGRGAAAAEQAAATNQALKDAQNRIAELEKTLKSLQQAIELRNQTLAQLQAQADAAQGQGGPRTGARSRAGPRGQGPGTAEGRDAEGPRTTEGRAARRPSRARRHRAAEGRGTEGAGTAKAEPPKVPPPKAAEPSFLDDLFANVSPWAIGGAALAVLGGIAAFVAARRRKTTKFEDSIISGTDIKTNTVFGSTGGGVVNTGENSLATDFSREGLGNIDTDEVDPIAEAEVYLAYGRDAQAEEILKEALKKDPQRQEIHLKLLEIHAQHNKPSAFETVAAELFSVSKGQGETWHKAANLGRQLDPTNPLFAEAGAGAAAVTAAAAPRAEAAPAGDAARVGGTREGDSTIDFRMDDDISVSPTSGVKPKSPADILAGAQSELERTAHKAEGAAKSMAETAFDTAKSAATGIAGAATAAVAGAGALAAAGVEKVDHVTDKISAAEAKFDLDFHLDEADKPAPLRPAAPAPAAVDSPVFAETAPALARPQAAIDLDKLDLSFDPDKATFEDPTPSVLDGQWHDAATKLDLAKAYQEMGDVEGAREILQEVLHEGDEQQKTEAQSLLSRLG